MARRKNTRFIDPRYFMNEKVEHTSPILNENQQGPLMPFLTGQGDTSNLEALKGYQIGNIDLADFVRDWNMEVGEFAASSINIPSGTRSDEIAAAYMKKNPKRAKAFEYLKGIVQMFDEYSAASKKAIEAGEDVNAVNDMYMQKYGKQLMGATKQLPKLFGKRSGDMTSGAEARQKRAAVAKKQSRVQSRRDQDRMRQANTDARNAPQQSFEEAQQKITKSQLKQMIKEELAKELDDENLNELFGIGKKKYDCETLKIDLRGTGGRPRVVDEKNPKYENTQTFAQMLEMQASVATSHINRDGRIGGAVYENIMIMRRKFPDCYKAAMGQIPDLKAVEQYIQRKLDQKKA
jgi:hypothetical protein